MARKVINRGSAANDGTGDNLRDGAGKINDNFTEIYTALGDGSTITAGSLITDSGSFTLTNKVIALGSNTVSGTTAQFNTALTDGSFATLAGSEALTNKDLTGSGNTFPTLSITGDDSSAQTISLGGGILFTGGSGITTSVSGSEITFATDGSIVTETSTDTLTNKTINGPDNTITNLANSNLSGSAGITNANLANSSITIRDDSSSTDAISLGETLVVTGGSGVDTAISSNELTLSVSGLTNSNLSGSAAISNANLANSSVTLGATAINLGATAGSATNFNLSGTSSLSGTGTINTTGAGNKLRFNVAAADATALGSAIDPTTYEGMFAYNTTENLPYVADTGGWVKLLSENSNVQELQNVDISGIANGNALIWNSSSARFEAGSAGGFSGGTDLDQAGAHVADVGYIGHRSPDATVTQTLTVTVATKTSEHVAFGDGSSSGYLIDGHEGAHLDLAPGVWKFDQADSSNSGHPLRFYDTAGKNAEYTTNVTTAGTPGSSGAYTQITITKATPSTLHYQCSSHANMGGVVSVLGSELPRVTENLTVTGHILPGTHDTYDLGASGNEWANIYTGDLNLSNMNKEQGNDVDGTKGNWTIQEGDENLFLINNNSGKKYKFKLEEI